MKLSLLAFVTLIFATPLAFAQGTAPHTAKDAAIVNAKSAALQGFASWAISQYDSFTTDALVDQQISPRPLTVEQINSVVETAKTSPFKWLSFGRAGGDRVVVDYDAAQVARMAGARNAKALSSVTAAATAAQETSLGTGIESVVSTELAEALAPKWSSLELNTATENIHAELTNLAADAADVRLVSFKGVLTRNGSRVAGTLTALLFVGASSNAATTAYLAYQGMNQPLDTWESSHCRQVQTAAGPKQACDQPGYISLWLNSADAVYYHFQADK